MTVADGYTLKTSDYPTVPAKTGYSGAWQKYTAAIHSNITVQATYTALAQYTVKFVADGVTVKTMTVYDGYVLKASDYPAVPEKEGYSGAWSSYTSAIHEDITISAAYLPNRPSRYTVTFKHLNETVSTLKVDDGQILRSKNYPTPPTGYGWNRYTNPIHADITINTTLGTGKHLVEFEGNLTLAKIMAVADGYKLKDSDYPDVPAKSGYTGTWTKYTAAIHEDITVSATYKKDIVIKPPTRPTGVIASEDFPEPIEPQDVEKPDDTSGTEQGETVSDAAIADNTANSVEPQASHPGQTLVSTQTVTHEYLTLRGKVARETVKKNGSVTDVMDFVYDESGRPFAMIHQAGSAGITLTIYFYVLNLQGDVVKLVNADGTVVASYEYDAWGNLLSKSGAMANKNPLRYRGYYYDAETGYYYLQSRYYDPANRRFINADSYASTGQGFIGTNMFAYCNNCPIIFSDPQGQSISRPNTVINDGGSGGTGWFNSDYTYKYAPDGYTASIFKASPYDSRANQSYSITYLSPSQVEDYVMSRALQLYTEPLTFSDIASDFVSGSVARFAAFIDPKVALGVDLGVSFVKYYGKARQSQDAQTIVNIMNANTGMVIVDYSVGGVRGRWYLPWSKDEHFGEFGSYPFARIS